MAEIKGLRELNFKLNSLSRAVANNPALMGEIGSYLEYKILERAARGVDSNESLFKPYSPEYAEFRREKGYPINKVDLFFTGSMLSSLTHNAEKQKVTLFFMPTTDKFGVRNPEKAYYNQKIRDFFSIGAKDIIAIEKIINDAIGKAVD